MVSSDWGRSACRAPSTLKVIEKAVISEHGKMKQEFKASQGYLVKTKANENHPIAGDKEVMAFGMDKLPPRKSRHGFTTKRKGLGRT